MRLSIKAAQYAAKTRVAVRGERPVAPTYVDVQPPMQASLPDSKNKMKACSNRPSYLVTPRTSRHEDACAAFAGGKAMTPYASAHAADRIEQNRNSWAMVKCPSKLAASKGTKSAPMPKKIPNRFNMGPRCLPYTSDTSALVHVFNPPPPSPSRTAATLAPAKE